MGTLRFPSTKRAEGFPRWRVLWWLLLYVEDALSRLPMLLLGPTAGAVIGTAVAVSELSSVKIDGKTAAAVPSVWAVLWPALLGGIGGIVVLIAASAAWGALSYFGWRGDDIWKATMPSPAVAELVCGAADPVGPDQLGAAECVIQRPDGTFRWTNELTRRAYPYGAVARIDGPQEAGTYKVRWYATEHKRRIHEVARIRRTFAAQEVDDPGSGAERAAL